MVLNPRNIELYNKARELRKQGLSYRDISKRCITSKSNISLWCKDIKLSPAQYDTLIGNKNKILELGSKRLHEIRTAQITKVKELAKKEMGDKTMTSFTFLVAGAMLYWAEGSKTVGLAVTNSDERIILFMIKWLKKFLDVDIERIKAHLHIHEKDEDLEIKKYWSNLTGIPLKNFGKSFIKPRGTGHRKNILPHGIIRIQVYGTGMEDYRYRIMTWVEEISKFIIAK
jgi:hypothetical protein